MVMMQAASHQQVTPSPKARKQVAATPSPAGAAAEEQASQGERIQASLHTVHKRVVAPQVDGSCEESAPAAKRRKSAWSRVVEYLWPLRQAPSQLEEPAIEIPVATDEDARTCEEAEAEAETGKDPKILLVVGECGDGKSTLINALRDPKLSGMANAGLNSRGVTKDIEAYIGKPIGGHTVEYLDTPGIGDSDVTPMKVLTLIEQELMTDEMATEGSIDGVIVTTPIPDGRVKLGAQVVQMLVEHGFVGEEKWRNVILVGTKADRATPEEIDLFRTTRTNEAGQPEGIAAQFFSMAPGGMGTAVLTSKDEYSDLKRAIAKLPSTKVQYGTPDTAQMAEVFSKKLGVDPGLFQKELEASRTALQRELNQQLEEKQRFKLELDEMRRKMEEERQDFAFRLHSASNSDDKRRLQEALAEKDRQMMQLHQKLAQQEKQQRARNYNFGETAGVDVQSCKHERWRRWGNAHGRGRKCLACKAELGAE